MEEMTTFITRETEKKYDSFIEMQNVTRKYTKKTEEGTGYERCGGITESSSYGFKMQKQRPSWS